MSAFAENWNRLSLHYSQLAMRGPRCEFGNTGAEMSPYRLRHIWASYQSLLFFSSKLSSLELSDTKVHELEIRALLGTASHFCEVVVLTGPPIVDERLRRELEAALLGHVIHRFPPRLLQGVGLASPRVGGASQVCYSRTVSGCR